MFLGLNGTGQMAFASRRVDEAQGALSAGTGRRD